MTEPPRDFMAAICVVLPQPVVVPAPQQSSLVLTEISPTTAHESGEMLAIGYYRNLGVRADPEHVKNVLMAYVTDGDIHWGQSAWHEMEEHDIPATAAEGVWYAGAQVYFSAWC
jgi:hypothetical protein